MQRRHGIPFRVSLDHLLTMDCTDAAYPRRYRERRNGVTGGRILPQTQPENSQVMNATEAGPRAWPLEVLMFGPFEVRLHGAPLPRLRSRKGHWLLALLALR